MNFLHIAISFLVISFVAGFFGFYRIEHSAVNIAKIAFFICAVLFVITLVSNFVW